MKQEEGLQGVVQHPKMGEETTRAAVMSRAGRVEGRRDDSLPDGGEDERARQEGEVRGGEGRGVRSGSMMRKRGI